MDYEVLDSSVTRLAINFSKHYRVGEKESYSRLLFEFFKNVDENVWVDCIEKYISNPEQKKMPMVGQLKALLPKQVVTESTGCGRCYSGMISTQEKTNNYPWRSVAYTCNCTLGETIRLNANGFFESYPCSGCRALRQSKNKDSTCWSSDYLPHEVNCLRHKRRLTEKTAESTPKRPLDCKVVSEEGK